MKTARRGEPTPQQASVLQREPPRNAVSQVTDYCETGKQEFHEIGTSFSTACCDKAIVAFADQFLLHLHFDLQLAVAGNLDGFSALQVGLQHRRIAPLQVPAIGQREHGVLAGNNVGQREGAVAVALIAAE